MSWKDKECGVKDRPKWVNVKTTKDGYDYAERKGKDSIAFVIFNENGDVFLLNQYNPAIDSWVCGAFTGSIDPESSLQDILFNELEEEAGLKEDDIITTAFIGKTVVCTQMNQYCYLFAVRVKDTAKLFNNTPDHRELKNSIEFFKVTDVPYRVIGEDWKSYVIINEYYKRGF